MKYLSVCSGIEAATVAWHPLGFQPLAFSEIDPFARAVLAHHYPDVPIHGDFTALRDQPWIIDADLLVGGTPCQAFSVAGLRNSLADERGNLSLEFVRLADAIDALRQSAGLPPAIIVWENVPGVLSVRDNAFGCFLAALAGDAAPYDPPRRKWTNAGVADGPERTVAWRILDAQYFRLAQRRRRVFVVASAREGFDPAAVLLEFEGMRRDSPPRREAGQAASGGAGTGAAVSSGNGWWSDSNGVGATIRAQDSITKADTLVHGSLSHWDGIEHPHPTLNQSAKATGQVGYSNQELFSQRGAYLVGEASTGDVSHCLNAGGMGRQDFETETLVAHSLRAEGFDASEDGTGRGTPLVSVAIPIHEVGKRTGASTDDPRAGIGIGEDGDPMYTLQAGAQHGVAVQASQSGVRLNDTVGTLDANYGSRRHNGVMVPAAYAFQPRIARNGRGDMGDVVNALNAQSGETGKGDAAPCVAVAFHENQRAEVTMNDTAGSLKVGGGKPGQGYPAVMQHMAVRRLTPVECSRLQGFPDDYLLSVTWRGKRPPPDGPMYKALGNSMAVPCMRWIGRRIAEALK